MSVAGDTIAFRRPDAPPGGVPTWFEHDGRRAGPVFAMPIPPILYPQISPDGTRLAAIVDGSSLWVYPLDGRPPVRLTERASLSPRWSPDGQSIVYERYGTVAGLHSIAADGSSSVPRAVGPPGHFHPHGFIAGGRGVLAISQPPGSAGWALVEMAFSGTEAPARLGDIALPDGSAGAALSPDGKWLAYITDTTGRAELWVRRYPTLDGAVRISPNGAAEPVWAKNGRELFYLEGDKLMRVRVGADTKAGFAYEPPVMLVEKSFMRAPQEPSFDVAADGRLLMLGRVPAGPSAPIEVIVNWRDRVARR